MKQPQYVFIQSVHIMSDFVFGDPSENVALKHLICQRSLSASLDCRVIFLRKEGLQCLLPRLL